MVKRKKGGAGKKKGKKKAVVDPTLLTEVDKTFYELQITDLNRKLARLRSLTSELELKNEELIQANKKLDEDRADVIAFLKRSLQEKADEIKELQERLKGLQEKREVEIAEFQQKIEEQQEEYTQMREQLTSEIKLLTGKLNALEEFRIQRDDIMKKYEIQEAAMEEQEIKHKREIYEIEKKFIIGKDKLKKEMEARLLQLSTEFQDASNLRIAATTHRVIRENIAINNELDVILDTHNRLHSENEELKKRDRTLRLEAELHEAEKNKALGKSEIQNKLIQRLTKEYHALEDRLCHFKDVEKQVSQFAREKREFEQTISNLEHKMRILEQNLHASRCDRVSLTTDLEYSKDEVVRLTDLLTEAVMTIRKALEVKTDADETLGTVWRENLLVSLLNLLSKVNEQVSRQPSLSTVDSFTAIYAKGDLGFVPKPVVLRSKFPTKHHVEAQVGGSLEDLIAARSDEMFLDRLKDILGEEEEYVSVEESQVSTAEMTEMPTAEKESQVFFDDEPEPLSEASAEVQEVDLTMIDFPATFKGRDEKDSEQPDQVPGEEGAPEKVEEDGPEKVGEGEEIEQSQKIEDTQDYKLENQD